MEKLGAVIKRTIKDTETEKLIDKGKIISLWPSIVGKKINEKTETKTIKKGVLTIKTKDSVWRNELVFQKTDIIDKINRKLEKKIIKDIRFL